MLPIIEEVYHECQRLAYLLEQTVHARPFIFVIRHEDVDAANPHYASPGCDQDSGPVLLTRIGLDAFFDLGRLLVI